MDSGALGWGGFGGGNAAALEPQQLAAQWSEMLKSLPGLRLAPDAVSQIQADYVREAAALWNTVAPVEGRTADGPMPAPIKDRRFAAPDWLSSPASAFMAAMYLLNARTLLKLSEQIEGDDKTRQRVRFAVQQFVDAASPSNYLALNPEVQRKAIETHGESIAHGLQRLWQDLRQGHLSQTDESVFEVGRNVATTEGAVVFENPLFQLIEYKPLTAKVHERPLLIVPPCINKYYILDLQPDNSLVRHAVSEGHRVFMLSWASADDSLAEATWDDYVEHGVIRAVREVQAITNQRQINALGFCIGGTLLGTALAALAARKDEPVASLTLLTSFLDFSDTGVLDLFVDDSMVKLREMAIGKRGVLKGRELATTFSFLRPNELVWNYVVGNYLKGETPPPFDLLYWNSDSTDLPGPMYCWYLRHTYLENNLVKPGKVTVCGEPLDFSKLRMPAFVYASREDHIVPWQSAYGTVKMLSGPVTFVLGASGHIAGVINPPVKKKRSHWVDAVDTPLRGQGAAAFPPTAQAWLAQAREEPGSWWSAWMAWLEPQAGKLVAAPKAYGDRQHPPIEAAPGRYVKVRA